jgi:Nucleotide modification associated domain 3
LRIIFSRKGFDTASGGAASPIINGRPFTLPIPTDRRSVTSYDQLGLGDFVEKITRGKTKRDHLCHEDPMFVAGQCIFGQTGAAQSHLKNQGVSVGDVFLFFGLFANEFFSERHHRIFGFLKIERIISCPGGIPQDDLPKLLRAHPHTLGSWNSNDTIYCGIGATAKLAQDGLRLTQPGGPVQHWAVPTWLKDTGLSFHGKAERWLNSDRLQIVGRGQEFVADISARVDSRRWLDQIIGMIKS